MIKQRKIELLAPAKNLECGIEAINHGADAVYIGAPKFGARAAAVNSLEDIEALVKHAHLYNARIYVTVNTILKEEELQETEEMIHALYRIGVDALIVQDMGITQLNLPPIPLHASTQMDNRTPEKVKFLKEGILRGFRSRNDPFQLVTALSAHAFPPSAGIFVRYYHTNRLIKPSCRTNGVRSLGAGIPCPARNDERASLLMTSSRILRRSRKTLPTAKRLTNYV